MIVNKISTYTAWVCADCEDATAQSIKGQPRPVHKVGLKGAARDVLVLKWKYPDYEWGIYYDETERAHFNLHITREELLKLAQLGGCKSL